MTTGILRSITDNNSKRLSQLLRHQHALKLTPNDIVLSLASSIRQCRPECVDSLLNAGADANGSDDEGRPMLFLLMEHGGGNPVILRSLLEAKANPNKVTWTTQQTPLHAAAKRGYQVCIKHLVMAGAEVNRRCSGGQTALMFAAREGHVTVVRSLLGDGADPNLVSDAGESALHYATRNGQQSCVEELLAVGCDVNIQDMRGQTPLMLATQAGNLHLISLFLDCHASVNAQDVQTGKSVLHYAVETGDIHLVSSLLHRGADPDIRDASWQTPFMRALNMNRRDMMEQLLKHGCRITNTDRSFNTALHIAANNGQTDMIPLLVDRGLSVDIKGNGGVTPLMLASLGGHMDTIDILLEYEADASLSDRNHANALVYALLANSDPYCRRTIVKMLIRANCNLSQSANLKKVLKMAQLELKGFTVEDRFYTLLEIAFIRSDSACFMMLLTVGSNTNNFSCDKDLAVMSYQSEPTDLTSRWKLLRRLKREKKGVKSLKKLCRRPLLLAFKTSINEKISSLPISDHLKGFLQFAELDEICDKYEHEPSADIIVQKEQEQDSGSNFTRNVKTRQTHLGLSRQHAANPYGTLPRIKPAAKAAPKEPQFSHGTLRKSQQTGRTRHGSGASDVGQGRFEITPHLRRRGYSTNTTPMTSPGPSANPVDSRFQFPPSNQGTPRSKIRSRSSRDSRETITNMLHGTADEYCHTGEITPKPLTMDLIETLSKKQSSPKDDYDSVNTFLYGPSQTHNGPSLDKHGGHGFQERVTQKRKDTQGQIANNGGVGEYINAEIHCLTDAIRKAWGDEVFQGETEKINQAILGNKSGSTAVQDKLQDKEALSLSLSGMHKWTAMDDLKGMNPVNADIDNGKNLPIMTLNQHENSSSSIEALSTDQPQNKKPLALMTNSVETQDNGTSSQVHANPGLLSPQSMTSSSDSSNNPGILTFPSGDPQLLQKYLRMQEKVVTRPGEENYRLTPTRGEYSRNHTNLSKMETPPQANPAYINNGITHSAGTTMHNSVAPTMHRDDPQLCLTPARGRTSSISSYASSTDPQQRRSRIPVMQWAASRARLMSSEPDTPSQAFRRTKSFRH